MNQNKKNPEVNVHQTATKVSTKKSNCIPEKRHLPPQVAQGKLAFHMLKSKTNPCLSPTQLKMDQGTSWKT